MLGFIKKSISIRVTVVFVFVFGTLITAMVAILLQYIFSSNMAKDAVTAYATSFARNTQKNVTELNFKASHSLEILAHNASLTQNGKIITTSVDSLFFNLLGNNNEFYAAYIGLDNGDFYEVINLEASPLIRQKLGASLTDRYAKVIIEGTGQQRLKRTIFLNEKWEAIREVAVFSEYDASVRPWFQNASSIKATKSKPYLFQHLQSPGQTYSMKIDGTKHVIAIDIALSTMSGFLSNQVNQDKSIGKSDVFLFDSTGVITASNINSSIDKNRIILPTPLSEQEQKYIQDLPAIRVSNETDWAPLDYSIAGKPRGYIVEQTEMLAHSLGLDIEYVNGVSWGTLVDYFHSGDIEILTPIYRTGTNSDWGLFSDPIVDMKMSIATLNDTPAIRLMSDLEFKSVAIPKGWSIIPELRKSYPNITILEVSSVSDALNAVLNRDVHAALESNIILRYSQGIYHLSGMKITDDINIQSVQFDSNLRYLFHPKHSQLRVLMNRALRNFSGEDKAYLENKWINNLSGLAKTHSTVVPYTELITSSKDPLIYGTLQEREINGKEKMLFVAPLSGAIEQYFAIVLNADDVLADSKKDVYISTAITTFFVLLLVPLCWVLANPIVRPIRELALENEKIMYRKYNSVKRHRSSIREIDDLSSSLVEMSKAIAKHAAQQQKLMDSFVELIAQAIDDKSPYTGGHCHRVPELGLMLANIASKDTSPYFKDFTIEDEDRQREFKLAAWLHDCGKITTPEHVVDKGSKLETSYNRIHEIRTRFEIIWRDIELEYYQNSIEQPSNKEELITKLKQRQKSLVEDFMFVAKCNIGGEEMHQDEIDRLHQIAQVTWVRHFDDRVGLSPIEERRLTTIDAVLPVTEKLIDDKPEHKISWERIPNYDAKFNITLQPPELQNNQGELYNLSTRKGTLNNEERYRINEHAVSTIKILEGLPFPPELANVPRFASTHHETLKGTGYPRGLSDKDLTIGERILVIADIFEALTADDRPYKKAKSLTSALSIMKNMAENDHIDKKVFNLFLSSNTHLKYANQYLLESRVENVDIEQFLIRDA